METWEKMERLRELLGNKAVLDELLKWVNSDTLDRFADECLEEIYSEERIKAVLNKRIAEENYDNKTS